MRSLSVTDDAPSAVVENTIAPGASPSPGVPSTSACILAYSSYPFVWYPKNLTYQRPLLSATLVPLDPAANCNCAPAAEVLMSDAPV